MILESITSVCNRFRCKVYSINNGGKDIIHSISTAKGVILCGEVGQSFIITVETDDDKVYGAKLFVDDIDVYGVKTFRKHGTFLGIKKGEGKFKELVFKRPSYDEDIVDDVRPTICIDFYETTKKRYNKKGSLSRSLHVNSTSGKKFEDKPIVIGEGRQVLLHERKFRLNRKKADCVDFKKKLDSIEFFYFDFQSLELKGIVSIDSLNYLALMPLINDSNVYIIKALKTIITSNYGLNFREIEDKFKFYTKRNLKDFYNLFKCNNILEFIKINYLHFTIDYEGIVTIKEYKQNEYCKIKKEETLNKDIIYINLIDD
jgi:hypothetical protein